MGGNATFNLASAYGVGLLEFSFGKDGISSRLGMGGTNISVQNLRNVPKGIQAGYIGNTGVKSTGSHLHVGYQGLIWDEYWKVVK